MGVRRISNKRRRQYASKQLLQAITALMQAETWDDRQRIVEEHPKLLCKKADLLLAQLAVAQDDDDTRQMMEEQRVLLRRCNVVGVSTAFQEQIGHAWRATGALSPELCSILAKLDQPAHPSDMPSPIALYRQALDMVAQEEQAQLWATLQGELGVSLAENPLGSLAENIDLAIHHFGQALSVYTREEFPIDWAATQNHLGGAYTDRIHGERAENLEHAIQYCEQALAVFTLAEFPIDWANTQNNLGLAYLDRIFGERAENLERAIHYFEQALTVYTLETFPDVWAMVQNNLGSAYANRIYGERAENLERAIHHGEQALIVYTQEDFPIDWAMTQNNLGSAYSERIRGERAENLEHAIHHFEQTLSVYTQQDFPANWAGAHHNLGGAYSIRIRGKRAANIERAIHHCDQALFVWTQRDFPEQWAMLQINLGNVYGERVGGERAENLERAIHHFEQALSVYTQEAFPIDWAGVHYNLAGAYTDRIRGERVENLERAIHHCEQALLVWSQQKFPDHWAMAQNTLGNTYVERIRGERAENLERAIHLFEQALSIYTQEAFPDNWAMTQNNLGGAYADRLHGPWSENRERAIHHFEQALSIYTQEAFPANWAMMQYNLGEACRNRLRGEPAENLERAIRHFKQALLVWTQQEFPADWAKTEHYLGEAYCNRTIGERAENVARAIHHFELALSVFTQAGYPAEHQHTQHKLGALYLTERQWSAAVAALRGALAAGEQLYTIAATPEARQAVLRELSDAPMGLAYALSQQVGDTANLTEAIETIERNRARWLAESLALHSVRPAGVPNHVWQRFTQRASQIQELQAEAHLPDNTPSKRDFLTLSRLLAGARQELTVIIDQVRTHNPDFMPQPSFASIQTALAEPGQVGVYLLTAEHGGLALIVHVEGITPAWLGNFTEPRLRELLERPTFDPATGGWLGAYANRNQDFAAWLHVIDHVTHRLWQDVMGPLSATVRTLHDQRHHPTLQVILIPTGLLALLPLHAAWTEDVDAPTGRRYFMDEFVASYAPSAMALDHAHAAAAMESAAHLLAVDEPGPLPNSPLPNAATEVDAIVDLFTAPVVLRHAQATRDAVMAALPPADVVHMACHGQNKWGTPLESGLLMANDERITVRDLMALEDAAGRLVSLSACETGIVGTDLPDEVIMLPSALLQVGFGGVVASLWSVADVSTAILMERFHRCWRKEGLKPAQALQSAQRWLRDTTNREKADYFRRYSPTLDHMRMLEATAVDFFAATMSREVDQRDFEHPFWWAAFYLTGV